MQTTATTSQHTTQARTCWFLWKKELPESWTSGPQRRCHRQPTKVASIIITYITPALSTVSLRKGKHLPTEAPRHYPWDQGRSIDEFRNTCDHSRKWSPNKTRVAPWLNSRQMRIPRMLKLIKTYKTSGPDSIVNEVLKILPFDVCNTIHMLFNVMWVTGITPKSWKVSDTVLIDKNTKTKDQKQTYIRTGQWDWPTPDPPTLQAVDTHLVQAMDTHDH